MTIADLERRYDGPIPPRERDAARGINAARVKAIANSLWFKNLALQYVKTLRRYRERGEPYPQMLLNDFRLYLTRYRHWSRRARQLTNPGAAP